MIEEVKLPEISENVESGQVINILVSVGDLIQADQPVVELETDKATFEFPSPIKGQVVEIPVKKGQTIKVGDTIIKVDPQGQGLPAEAPPAPEIQQHAQTIKDEPETDSPEAESAPQPVVLKETPAADPAEPSAPAAKPQHAITPVNAAPSVRQLARELGVDINAVPTSGSTGRISQADVKLYAGKLISRTPASPTKATTAKPLPDFAQWGEIERQPLTAIRKVIADHLSYAWATIPHVTQFDKADITELEEFRAEYAGKVEQAGGKLTVTAILLKACASALKEFPRFNASLDPASREIIYKKYFHLGVAVDTDRGLLVPVVRDVDKKTILEIAVELADLAQKARNKKITPEQMTGGSFTVTNLGGIGGTGFTPIINWPEVAILGLARASEEPVNRQGRIELRKILPLSLSYDHRVIDGADGARFLQRVVQIIQSPFLLAAQE